MDINQVTLVGRLGDKVMYTKGEGDKSSRAVARLIVNRPPRKNSTERSYDAIQIVAWGRHADNMAQWTDKGKEIAITGQIRVNNVPPSTPGGEWKNYTEVQISSISFGRDSQQAKVMKALQGTGQTLTDAQAALASGADAAAAAAAAVQADPQLAELLKTIVAQGAAAPAPAQEEAQPEAPAEEAEAPAEQDVENPFED
jgi:single-strand DNA-binding protein